MIKSLEMANHKALLKIITYLRIDRNIIRLIILYIPIYNVHLPHHIVMKKQNNKYKVS
jgi:hypothetical protein